ncbi:MAG: uncharacterized protein PWQ12_1035 [Clostridiales bacterium]|jgi:hypothetical protein|nr:uncharacterized protein [Clostridiales bacterium]
MKALKVIFHMDEINKWKLLIGNVTNLLAAAEAEGDAVEIEVLANAEAVLYFVKMEEKPHFAEIKVLVDSGVRFAVCNNALRAHQVQLSDLPKFVNVVPAGVFELAKRQAEGYGYIKP